MGNGGVRGKSDPNLNRPSGMTGVWVGGVIPVSRESFLSSEQSRTGKHDEVGTLSSRYETPVMFEEMYRVFPCSFTGPDQLK